MGRAQVFLIFSFLFSPGVFAAEPTFSGVVKRHKVQYTRTVRCQTNTSDTGTYDRAAGSNVFAIPSDFGCPAQAFSNGKLTLELPSGKLSATVDNPTAPEAVTLQPPLANVKATASGAGVMVSQSESGHIYELTAEVRGVTGCTAVDRATGSRGSPGSVNLTASASCALGGLRVASQRIEQGRLVSFEASFVSRAHIVIGHQDNPARGGEYELRVTTFLEFAPEDKVELSFPVPDSGERLDPLSDQGFAASVDYGLNSEDEADLVLRLYDRDGRLLGESTPKRVRRGSGNEFLELDPIRLPRRPDRLLLRGALLSIAKATLKESADISYPLWAELTVDHLEVVQVTQDAGNTVPLLARKPTAVRVFTKLLEAKAAAYRGVRVELYGYNGGGEVAGSPLAVNSPSVRTPKTFNRDSAVDAHPFILPASWYAAEGPLRLRAVINPAGEERISEEHYDNNEKEVTVTLLPSDTLAIRYLRVCTKLPDQPRVCPSEAVGGLGDFIPRLYPVADADYQYGPLDVPTFTWPKVVNRATRGELITLLNKRLLLYREMSLGRIDQILAWLPDIHGESWGGFSDPRWAGGQGLTALGVAYPGNPLFGRLTVAHEVGHNMGLHHPATPDDTSQDPDTDWQPRDNCRIQEPGVDPRTKAFYRSDRNFDVMSYKPSSERWIAPFHYRKLHRSRFVPQLRAPVEEAAGGRRPAGGDPIYVISGWVDRDGTRSGLEPMYRVPEATSAAVSDPNGNHCLLLQGDSASLGEHCFPLSFLDHETLEELETEHFVWTVAVPTGARRIALVRGEQELAVLTVSPNAPQVAFVTPQAGDEWDGGERTISWTGSDTDGDSLAYSLLYTFDDGSTWLPLVVDSKDAQFTLNPASLQGGEAIRFRVMATDGMNTAEAEAGPIRIIQIPKAEVATDRVDFLNVLLQEAGKQQVTLRSTGSGPLKVLSLTTDDPAFTVELANPFRLEAEGERPLTVLFAPTEIGEATGRLTIETDDPMNPKIEVELTGKGTDSDTPEIQVSPSSLDFGNVATGQYREVALTILNRGPSALTVSGIQTDHEAFGVAALEEAIILKVGETHTVNVRFEPADTGAFSAKLTIASDDPEREEVTVALSGTGVATLDPVAQVSPASLDFGGVRVGASKELAFSVGNAGGSPLVVVSVISSDAAFVVLSPEAPFTVDSGSQAVRVKFEPSEAGDFTGAITLATNDPARELVEVAVAGKGTTIAPPNIAVSPAALDFGRVASGQTKDLTLTVRNEGEDVLRVTAMRSSNPKFTSTGAALPLEIAAEAEAKVTVRFAPDAVAVETGELSIESNDPDQAKLTVALAGEGVTPVIPGRKGAVQFSDSFDRPNADRCLLGKADNALGGKGDHYYLPLFAGSGGETNPVGIPIYQNALRNFGRGYAAVMFSGKPDGCVDTTAKGENLGNDLNLRVELLLPGGTYVSQGGIFLRGKALGRGGDLRGDGATGYWVQLHSTGEVKVQSLASRLPIAVTGKPESFDAGAWHTLEVALKGFLLEVAVDGKLQTFRQDGRPVTAVQINSERHEGTAGLAFGAEDNPNQIGGQQADNVVVMEYDSLSPLPVQSNY